MDRWGEEAIRERDAEIERLRAVKRAALKLADERAKEAVGLRAALKDLFLLACVCNEIRPDCKQMREAGKLLALEQNADLSQFREFGGKE